MQYRQELDFRVGCAMTNIQTLLLKRDRAEVGRPINFGTCLIPLLNLIVQRFIKRKVFVGDMYWQIKLLYQSSKGNFWISWDEDYSFEDKNKAYFEA